MSLYIFFYVCVFMHVASILIHSYFLLQFNNKPNWEVLTGRRDGTVSKSIEALINIPAPFHNITQLRQIFANKKLTLHDLVVLSGTFN